MRKLQKPKKKWTTPIIILGILCFIVSGAVTWYFGYVRPRLNAEPIRVYKPIQPTQKTATGATEKLQTATPTNANLDTNQDVFVEAERASSHKTSKKTGGGVENSDSLNSPNETQQMTSEQDDQKRARDIARREEYERIVAKNDRILKMIPGALARQRITTEFLDKFLPNLEDGMPEEELRRQRDVYFNTVMPRLVEQLKVLPIETQREFSERLLLTVSTMAKSPEEAEKLQNRMSELLLTHGVQLPD